LGGDETEGHANLVAFGRALKRGRFDLGLSQPDVAARSGLSARVVCQAELARTDSRWSTLARLARAVDLDVVTMLRSSPEPSGSR
jgi:transcriptional regulator with XRE-family HTH domain